MTDTAQLPAMAAKQKLDAAQRLEKALAGMTPEEIAALKTLPKVDKQRAAAALMFRGLSKAQTSSVLGVSFKMLTYWFEFETAEMREIMKGALTADALMELPRTWRRLKSMRYDENAETSRKASLDCLRAAGSGVDLGTGGVTLNVTGAKDVNVIATSDLEREILKLARELGPEAERIVTTEFCVKDAPARVDAPTSGEPGTPRQGGPPAGPHPPAPAP